VDYESMTLLELKKICKERGLRISGNKDDVVIRLMEDDEGESQESGGFSSNNIIQINTGDGKDRQMITLGTCIILYSIFRGGMALMFLTSAGAFNQVFPSFIALFIAAAFMTGGVLTVLNYRNGLILTLGTLVISGLLSLLFSGDVSSLSIAWFGEGVDLVFSMMCSAVCMVIVGVPLLTSWSTLKPGWSTGINVSSSSSSSVSISSKGKKKFVYCPTCDKKLAVPGDYSGRIRCSHCDALMEV